jgi:hypothetical protein
MLWADTNKQGGGNDGFADSDRRFIDTDLAASDRFDKELDASKGFDGDLGTSDRFEIDLGTSDRFMFEAKALWHGAWIERIVLCDQRLRAGGLAT